MKFTHIKQVDTKVSLSRIIAQRVTAKVLYSNFMSLACELTWVMTGKK